MVKNSAMLFAGVILWTLVINHTSAAEPLVVAHRGVLRHAPENTLANFRACLELRLGFEFDVKRTRDGQLVCIHDDTVDRTTNGHGQVADLTLAELRQLDAGKWFAPEFTGEQIPTVEDVFKLIAEYPRHKVLIAVDLKIAEAEQELVQMARKYEILPRLLFIGHTISDPQVRLRLRQASPLADCATVANTPEEFSSALADPDSTWVYFRFLPTSEQIAAVHNAKKRAFIAGSTVSGHSPDHWQQAIDAGLDGILTDYSLELQRVLREQD